MIDCEDKVALHGLLLCSDNAPVFTCTYQQHVSLSQRPDKHLMDVCLLALTYLRYAWLSNMEQQSEATSMLT